MAVPEQIRKQTEDAKRLYTEAYGEDADGAEETSVPDAEPVGDLADAEQPDSAEDDATEASGSEHGADSDSKTYEQRYKTLQGMYNADVSRLRSANSDYERRIEDMEKLLASLSNSQPTQNADGGVPQKYVTDTDLEEYGESIDMMRRVSREELSGVTGKLSELENAIKQLNVSLNGSVLPQVQNVAKQQAMSREDKFWSDLSDRIPNWQQINNDQAFQSWLLEVDPLTGTTRQTFLENAQRDLDVNRVAAFFTAFTGDKGTPVDTNAQSNRSASELEKQVSPGRSRSAGTPANQSAKTYTADDIRKFFSDVQKGKYKGRESERDRIERDIFTAQREGRIV